MVSHSMVVTHADLDGMVSGILLLTRLGNDTQVQITNGERLCERIESILASEKLPYCLYIADIPLDGSQADTLLPALGKLQDSGTTLHLYDHHFGWERIENRSRFQPLFETYVIDTRKTTAAALVWKHFLRCDSACQRWLQLLSEKAHSQDEEIRSDFLLLAALMQPRHRHRRIDIMRCLSVGETISDRTAIVRWYVDEYLPREQSLAQNAEIVETSNGRRIGWVDLRECDELYPGLSRLIIKLHSADLAASVIHNGIVLGGSTIDGGIDLQFLHGAHVEGKSSFEVIGHRSPVRFRPVYGIVDDTFLLAVRQFICDRL